MTYPDSHPSGPWGPRELIAYARRNNWDHTIYGGSFGSQHSWFGEDYRVDVELRDGMRARVTVSKRHRRLRVGWEEQIGRFEVAPGVDVYGVLLALGVLPEMEKAA